LYIVEETKDLRTILAQNIRSERKALHLTQEKLAEFADISFPHLVDIERRRTWISDKTLSNIARALNREPYELLRAGRQEDEPGERPAKPEIQKIVELIEAKKKELWKDHEAVFKSLVRDLARLYIADAKNSEKP
jgi:transcriptional regulator with XRE-family HTH domain